MTLATVSDEATNTYFSSSLLYLAHSVKALPACCPYCLSRKNSKTWAGGPIEPFPVVFA
jgi:hypothetical protein